LQFDPIDFAGGTKNLFSYCYNSCTLWRDPLGEAAFAIPIVVGGGKVAGDLVVIAAGAVTAAVVVPAIQARMRGDCTEAEHRELQNRVDKAQAEVSVGGCKPNDSCSTLRMKKARWIELAQARSHINNRCFRGGDNNHQIEAEKAWNNVANCNNLINQCCSN
jgi:hypothetical protein